MSGRLSDTLANNLLNAIFAGVALTGMPSTAYLGLSTTTPTTSGGSVTEPTDANYARVAVTKNATNWPAAASRSISNGVVFTFPAASSGGSGYGGIVAVPIYDAATAGTYKGMLLVTGGPVTIGAGITPDFPAASLVWNAPST